MSRTLLLASLLALAACNDSAPAPAEKPAEPAKMEKKADHGDHGAHGPDGGAALTFEAAPEAAKVSFGGIAHGDTVKSPVKFQMVVEGMTVQKAGELKKGTGHHHVIVDGEGVAAGTPVPADETHIHFGGGQTETELELKPGKHTLTLQFADGLHRSYGPGLTQTIQIVVEE